jgi:hypothetical protein
MFGLYGRKGGVSMGRGEECRAIASKYLSENYWGWVFGRAKPRQTLTFSEFSARFFMIVLADFSTLI